MLPIRRGALEEFQSLSGFPMSCNLTIVTDQLGVVIVSIPIGFSNELQPESAYIDGSDSWRFNPYRVFQ